MVCIEWFKTKRNDFYIVNSILNKLFLTLFTKDFWNKCIAGSTNILSSTIVFSILEHQISKWEWFLRNLMRTVICYHKNKLYYLHFIKIVLIIIFFIKFSLRDLMVSIWDLFKKTLEKNFQSLNFWTVVCPYM